MPPRHPQDERARKRLRDLGDHVRRLRLERGQSQEAFAHQAGIHRTYVGAVERGEQNASVLALYRLADALGVPVSALFS